MERTYVVMGSTSGIGAATVSLLRRQGFGVIGLHRRDVDVVADLATTVARPLSEACRSYLAVGSRAQESVGFYDTPAGAYGLSNHGLRASTAGRIPLRDSFSCRMEQAAALLAWCVSPGNAQMAGQIFFADCEFDVRARKERAA